MPSQLGATKEMGGGECCSNVVFLYTTWPDADTAVAAGRRLVSQRLAACANVLSPATAIFLWDGKAEEAREVPMIVKTDGEISDRAIGLIRQVHPYDVPAIAELPVSGGDPAFLAWIQGQVAPLSIDQS